VEGNGTAYRFGDVVLTDDGSGQGPNAGAFFVRDNDGVDLLVPTSGNFSGPITVTTAGGTTAPFTVGFTGITAVAASGTAANPAAASANPNQTITLTGTGLTTSIDIIASFIDGNGNLQTQLFNPSAVSGGGTSATWTVPSYFNGVFTLRVAGATFAPLLQIVPVLVSVTASGANATRWRGLGFVEGNGTIFTLGAQSLTDASTGTGPNTGGFFAVDNDGADVGLGITGTGQARVTTIGGTSAPVTF
jgi:hypothetical protein